MDRRGSVQFLPTFRIAIPKKMRRTLCGAQALRGLLFLVQRQAG
jgi:hypothetical protein